MSTFKELSEDEAEEMAPKQKLKDAWNDFRKEKKDMLK